MSPPLHADPDERPVLLFDMDGVLLEGRGTDAAVHDRALDDALAERGLDVDPETRSLLAGYEYDTDFVNGCERIDTDPVELFELRERHGARRIIDRLGSGVRTPYADVGAIDDLAERYTLGVVSNNYDEVVRFVTRHHGLDAFSYVRGRDPGLRGFRRRKPDPHYLREAVDALDAGTGVYVGDRRTDIEAATRAGLDAVFLRRGHNGGTTLPAEPVLDVDSLTGLASQL
jgi:phosphoglycolate phosphatase-like HAD superfamily hydrolase